MRRQLFACAAFTMLLTACDGTRPVAPAANARAESAHAQPPELATPTPQVPTPTPVPTPVAKGAPPPPVRAAAYYVMDEQSGASLLASHEHDRLPPASLTKIATAAVVLEAGALDTIVEVHPDRERELEEDASTMGLEPGDRFSIRDLLYGLMLPSGNDAAEALAEQVAGGTPAFVQRMNALAARLGLQDTHFTDPHGLGGSDHYSSAHDMALLARYAMTTFPAFCEIVGSETHTAKGSREIELTNLNPLLGYTPGVDGVKTGYTEEAGRTFVVSATRNGHRVYVVLMNDAYRAQDAIALIEWAFSNYSWP